MRKETKKRWSRLLAFLLAFAMTIPNSGIVLADVLGEAPQVGVISASETEDPMLSVEGVSVDEANREEFAAGEANLDKADEFGWYRWDFDIDADMDTVGTVGDGKGELYFRLFVPETEEGEKYPLVANLGGLGSSNTMTKNSYAKRGMDFASDVSQEKYPAYVMTFNVPYEACVNYEAELAYIYEIGEIIKAVNEAYGNVDMNRIYSTGRSQGAGWSYELAAVQPDLLAAVVINAGTTIHTTWGDQCDMDAIADSDVNIAILHGFKDPYIPVNEAYRVYNTLYAKGKTNMIMDISNDGHCVNSATSGTEVTYYMDWMFRQVKGVPCVTKPEVKEVGSYEQYMWSGALVYPMIEGWTTAYNYAKWIEPKDSKVWDAVKAASEAYVDGEGGTGEYILSKIRIGDETSTQYDYNNKTLVAGDIAAVTVQGYTGGYGDDWAAFNKQWTVDWAVLEGSVTGIELTCEASPEPVLRPASVSLANGGGPNVNNSMYNENALDGKQVYIKIDTAEDFEGDTLKVAIRFTRVVGNGEYASYIHVLEYNVKNADPMLNVDGVYADEANKAEYATLETSVANADKFGWYRWEFDIDADMDTVGEVGDGKGEIYFRLFAPEKVEEGKKYPLVANLGGLGSFNAMDMGHNFYAYFGTQYASDVFQAEYPAYVMTFNMPYEACVNYEAELAYIYEIGEIIKAVNEGYGNVDMNRIYSTGMSQGAGWSYELAAVQPDLLAAVIINAGTTIHTTWGDQCDMEAIADSDVNVYILHGYNDPYIPVNEAYRTYHTLSALGKKNVILEVVEGGHCITSATSGTAITPYMEWMFSQVKGVPCVEAPKKTEEGKYADYMWAGVLAYNGVEGWTTAHDYANWTEPKENSVWETLKKNTVYAEGTGGTGDTVLAKIRIGDETATSYDTTQTIVAGDVAAVTVQGYTGGYGDDWEAFNEQWDVEWAVLEGSVTDIELTCEASEKPILRPESVTLANGGGPNVNNSLYNENTLDGKQVYIKIDTAEDFEGETLKVALRFTRVVSETEYASYIHVVEFEVKNHDLMLNVEGVYADEANKAQYAAGEASVANADKFGWYRWEFDIEKELDTVGTVGDGKGEIYFRLFAPENVKEGEKYPLVANLGGLGSNNAVDSGHNFYAYFGTQYASDVFQAENPSYVMTFNVPFEACVNYEAELAYIYEIGEIIKAVNEGYGNVDMDRIYSTGMSQGAGWSYELAAVQPDLLAAVLINAGTTIHTTWGDQCDMAAIAESDVNLYILHGYSDPYIPVNEAYRTYNTLSALGKENMILEVVNGGHCITSATSGSKITRYMEWMFDQVKGVPCTDKPEAKEYGSYDQYMWAGYLVYPMIEGWTTAYNYAKWIEPQDSKVWDAVKAASEAYVDGEGGTGEYILSKIRIGDETSTQYDYNNKTLIAGDIAAVTVQGYTGGYGDDWDAFNEQWSVDWAVLEGSVTGIELTCEASPEPVLRPASVSLANGGGPNVNNSMYNENALDGKQVYIKIDTAEDFEGETLKVAIRFTRVVGSGEYASYIHVLEYNVKNADPMLNVDGVYADEANKAEYAAGEASVANADKFGWYRWEFDIDEEMDTVGEVGDGKGEIYFRLFAPENAKEGEKYPLIANLGGLGSNNAVDMGHNFYAYFGTQYASDVFQAEYPAYVMTFNVPFEACVNYEAELAYIYELGEIIKAVNEGYGNVDMDRIYSTGMSQGAGWSYELAAVQPDLLAAVLINAGTTIHTTWGDQCDMKAIADSDVNVYILHGYSDPYIPVNEAYRTYHTLSALGKDNVILEVVEGGHCITSATSGTEITPRMEWLFSQVKGVPCVDEPTKTEKGKYEDYMWAGVLAYAGVEGWTTAHDYANWTEPKENDVWNTLKKNTVYAEGEGGTGETYLAKIRIGDETATSYDTTQEIVAGDVAAVTIQGYTGGYGDDWEAFNEQWDADWAVLEGSVTNIELTCEASAEPILRPESVTLANGGGPNVNNSLYNENTLDGKQVYIKIDTAEDFEGDTLKVALRFTRVVSETEYASYVHVVEFKVDNGKCVCEPFADVDQTRWYHAAVDYAVENGLMNGVSATSFDPEGTINRAMFVTILWRLDGEKKVESEITFEDVADGRYFTEAVRWAAENGIVEGYDGKFNPEADITREQMATILYRYAKYTGADVTAAGELNFADADEISNYAKEPLKWICGEELMQGKGNNVLDPLGTALRAEAAQLLMNYLAE